MYDGSCVIDWLGEPLQRTSVAHEPHVPERIEEVTLSVNAPRRIVISHVIQAAFRPRELESCDRPQAPQHRGAEGTLVLGDSRRCVGDGEPD
jgi:hypothetical protein